MILSFDLKYFSLFEVWVDNDVIGNQNFCLFGEQLFLIGASTFFVT